MGKSKGYKLAKRLTEILRVRRLNDGKGLTVRGLAKNFSVSDKTIQRNLQERLLFIDWLEQGPYYRLNKGNYGHINPDDLNRIISFLSIQNIFSRLDRHFFLKYLTKNVTIKNIEYECIQAHSQKFTS